MKAKPTYEELARRVEELEKRVQQLEAQPREHHYHYHPPAIQPTYQPVTLPSSPVYPYVGDPLPNTVRPIWGGETFTFTCKGQNL